MLISTHIFYLCFILVVLPIPPGVGWGGLWGYCDQIFAWYLLAGVKHENVLLSDTLLLSLL